MGLDEERAALASMAAAIDARTRLGAAKEAHDRAYLRYVRDARLAGWSWTRIGEALGLTEVAVRRYFDRNRQRAGRVGDVDKDQVLAAAG